MGERSYTEQYIEARRVDQHGEFDLTDAIETLEAADAEIAALRERVAELERSLSAAQQDRAFFRCCALSGEVPAEGAEPSALLSEGGEG
jgi:hypothetical protein